MSAPEQAKDPERIQPGVYLVDAPCPLCGVVDEILAKIGVTLTTSTDDIGSLKVRIKAKPREHDCQQQRITVTAGGDA